MQLTVTMIRIINVGQVNVLSYAVLHLLHFRKLHGVLISKKQRFLDESLVTTSFDVLAVDQQIYASINPSDGRQAITRQETVPGSI